MVTLLLFTLSAFCNDECVCSHVADLCGPRQVLRQSDIRAPGQKGPYVVERPKVIYNELTRLYVMWFHLDVDK